MSARTGLMFGALLALLLPLGALWVKSAFDAGTARGGGAGAGLLGTGELAAFQPAPAPAALPAFTFQRLDGSDTDLSAWRGRVVLLNLWATWCAPCITELPSLARLQEALGGADFTVLALSVDAGGAFQVERFLRGKGLEALPVVTDKANLSLRALQVRELPTTLLLDREGRELGRFVGDAAWDGPNARALIAQALASPGAGGAPAGLSPLAAPR